MSQVVIFPLYTSGSPPPGPLARGGVGVVSGPRGWGEGLLLLDSGQQTGIGLYPIDRFIHYHYKYMYTTEKTGNYIIFSTTYLEDEKN